MMKGLARMTYDKQKVLDIALSEVGYLEKASNSDLDSKTGNAGDKNYTKYSRDLAQVNYFNSSKTGVAWCAVFVAWDFFKAYGKEAALKLLCQPSSGNCGAGCRYAMNYFKAKGQLHTSNPLPGDVIFFYSSDKSSISHTGLVYSVTASKVYTVEGNTSGASGVIPNGGGVCKKSYELNNTRIAGYGRPDYGTETAVESPSQKDEQESTPSNGTPENANKSEETVFYTVKNGDTLWNISKKYLGKGNRYKEIMAANGMKSTIIRAGMQLKIPTS
ncbi:MAG: LysM peptidoglycan-binding domain-containing protein [Aristaeellaceae bacterium]